MPKGAEWFTIIGTTKKGKVTLTYIREASAEAAVSTYDSRVMLGDVPRWGYVQMIVAGKVKPCMSPTKFAAVLED